MKTHPERLKTKFVILATSLIFACTTSFSQINPIIDGGFEVVGAPAWIQSSTNFGTPICDTFSCGNGTGTGPFNGLFFVWFGGIDGVNEEASVIQTVTIPAGSNASLIFHLEQIICDGAADFMEVKIDNNVVFYTNGVSPLCGILGYSIQVVDISAYADGNPHTIEFHSITYSLNSTATNFFVDDISIAANYNPAFINQIRGRLFVDLNSNSIQDAGEPGLAHMMVEETNTGRFTFSNSSGDYNLVVLDSGNFIVNAPTLNYYNLTPSFYPISFSSLGNIDSSNNFIYQPQAAINDLKISMFPAGPFRSGFDAWYNVFYTNVGTTTLAPEITFFRDNDITYSLSNLTPSLISSDSVVWNPTTLAPLQSGHFKIKVQVSPALPLNTLVNSTIKIEPITGDANPVDNIHNWEIFTIGSYDPNDILVNREKILTTETSSPPFLHYVIRFQNTGNDTAFTVRVTNELLPKFNLNSFDFISASHSVQLAYNQHTQIMEFLFNNILLPDSNINEPESHGYIHYRIKPVNTLIEGDSILNSANIYFDFNLPVATNVAVTEVVLPVGMNQLEGNRMRLAVFPNPARNELNVKVSHSPGSDITVGIYDVFGRLVKLIYHGQNSGNDLQFTSDISELNHGVYFVKLESGFSTKNVRIVKF